MSNTPVKPTDITPVEIQTEPPSLLDKTDPIGSRATVTKYAEETKPKRKELVDMQSHSGLRGCAALWIVLFHAFRMSAYGTRINLNGSAAMSLFFILSGFPQAVIYGGKSGTAPCSLRLCRGGGDSAHDIEAALPTRFNAMRYWQNRFARLYPVYFLTSALALPLAWLAGRGDVSTPAKLAWYIVQNALLIQNWGMLPPNDYFGHSMNGAAWFCSVVWFQYLLFPFTLPRIQKCNKKVAWSIGLFFLQCAGSTGIFFGISPLGTGMSAATMNLFFPGMCMFLAGGLLGLWAQCIKDKEVANDASENVRSSFGMSDADCASVADASSMGLLLWLLVFTTLSACGISWGGFGAFFVQIYGSLAYLILVVALCFDNGKSLTATMCRSRIGAWMGNVSMSVYLIHVPLMEYTAVIINEVAPEIITDEDRANGIGVGFPLWTVPITVVFSYLFGVALERFVAVPTRNLLRAKAK